MHDLEPTSLSPRLHVREAICVQLLALLLCSACGDDEPRFRIRHHSVGVGGQDDGGLDDGGLGGELDSCEDAEQGQSCGPAHHCIEGACLRNRCGDGVAAGLEQCDDGNEIAGDACNPACVATPASCGDGQLDEDEGEECDDANDVDDDACSTGCTLNVCGNGRKDVGEECDDGNEFEDDACANSCTHIRCRNGRIDPGEECDDGNRINDDGCTNACVAVICGDGVVHPTFEECDDQNDVHDDACSNLCTANVCGNNRIDAQEVCDGSALPAGLSGICKIDCSGASSLEACDPCRRLDGRCTDYQGSGFNLLDTCLTEDLAGSAGDFVPRCTALSTCITQSRCDLEDPEIQIGCFCGVGNTLEACQNDSVPAYGPCKQEFLDAAGCGGQATPSQCVINLTSDTTLPVGYAVYLAECDRMYCLDECRPD